MGNVQALLKDAKKTYLTPPQRNQLDRAKRDLESQLSNPVAAPNIDAEVTRESLSRVEDMIQEGTPPELASMDKRRVYKRMKELETKLKGVMLSYEQMERPTAQNVDACLMFNRHHGRDVREWRRCRRILDPLNMEPNFTNAELLRTNEPSYVDMKAYWSNYPDFEDAIEDDLAEVDDETVLYVGAYRSAGWADKNICRKLSISKDQYRIAVSKLKELSQPEEEEEDAILISTPGTDTRDKAPSIATKIVPPSERNANPMVGTVKEKVLEVLETTGDSFTKDELAFRISEPSNRLTLVVANLVKEGVVSKEGAGKGTKYKRTTVHDSREET